MNKGYFYYSAGANFILSEALHLPDAINFAKVRISYAKVGNDVAVYATNPPQWTKQGNINLTAKLNTVVPYPGTYLAPEDNRSFEVGTEWRFAHDKVYIVREVFGVLNVHAPVPVIIAFVKFFGRSVWRSYLKYHLAVMHGFPFNST